MIEPTDQFHFECFGCNTIRVMDGPCPSCGRCAICGLKFSESQTECEFCLLSRDPEFIAKFKDKHAIPEEHLPRERRRMEIRKDLETPKQIAFSVLMIVIGLVPFRIVLNHGWGSFWLVILVLMVAGWVAAGIGERFFRGIANRRLAKEFYPENWYR